MTKTKFLTEEQVVDYIHQHKKKFDYIDKSLRFSSYLRIDDIANDFIAQYLSQKKRNRPKFPDLDSLMRYFSRSVSNKRISSIRVTARVATFQKESSEIIQTILSDSTRVDYCYKHFGGTEEMIDIELIARKTWGPKVAEANLKIIKMAPPEDQNGIGEWYETRKRLILRLYKTYAKKYKLKKSDQFINVNAAVSIIEGTREDVAQAFPEKRNIKRKKMCGNKLSYSQFEEVQRLATESVKEIREILSASGCLNRLAFGGIITGKERKQLDLKRDLDVLVSFGSRITKEVEGIEERYDAVNPSLIANYHELARALYLTGPEKEEKAA